MNIASLKQPIRFLRSVIRYPTIDVIMTIGIVAFVEWKYFDFEHLKSFTVIGSTLYFIITFFFAFVFVGLIRKAFSDSGILFDSKIKEKLDNIIEEADEYLYLISPYLDLGNLLTESLIKAIRGGVRVVMVHHTDQLKNKESMFDMRRLKEAGCLIWHHTNLHAKIYLNEKEIIITSLNMVKGSFNNSLESGYKTNHKALHLKTLKYIKQDILESDLIKSTELSDLAVSMGYCIRTKVPIPLNSDKPIEHDEYISSDRKKNGKYCHYCGEEAITSVDRPFCEKHKDKL